MAARGRASGGVTPVDRIKRKIKDTSAPVGLVQSTQKAKEACLKNGLSPAELLSPYTRMSDLDKPIRAASQQFRLQSFRLRLLDASEFSYIDVEEADRALRKEMQDISEKEVLFGMDAAPVRSIEDAQDLVKHTSFDDVMPFMRRFLDSLWKTGRCQPHDLLDHPVALFCVASTADEDPRGALQNMSGNLNLPAPFQAKQYDPELPRFYIVLHDGHSDLETKPEEIFKVVRTHFDSNACFWTTINSLQEESTNQPDLWSHHFDLRIRDTEPQQYRESMPKGSCLGGFLSDEDLGGLQRLMTQLIRRKLLIYLENKLYSMQLNVANHRRGLKNAIKSLWRRPKSSEEGAHVMQNADQIAQASYTFSTVEAQLRYLSDTLFQLGDYESALANYRSLREDYKVDKSFLHYASASEMIGLCELMQNYSLKIVETSLDHAIASYYRGARDAKSSGRKYVNAYASPGSQGRTHETDSPLDNITSLATSAWSGLSSGISTLLAADAYEETESTESQSHATPEQHNPSHIDAQLSAQKAAIRAGTRCSIWLIEVMKAQRKSGRMISQILRNAAEHEPEKSICKAVLLEHSSYCFLFTSRPIVRQYAFNLLRSSQAYLEADHSLKHHSIRCMFRASHVFENKRWPQARAAILRKLSTELRSVVDPRAACGYLGEALGSSEGVLHSSFQQNIMTEFRRTYEEAKASIGEFVVPSFSYLEFFDRSTYISTWNNASVGIDRCKNILEVPFGDEINGASITQRPWSKTVQETLRSIKNLDELPWYEVCRRIANKLEDSLDEKVEQNHGDGMIDDSRYCKHSILAREHIRPIVSGEPFVIGFSVRNRLSIPVLLQDMTPIIEYEEAHDSTETNGNVGLDTDELTENAYFWVSKCNVTIKPEDKVYLCFLVIPKFAGKLKLSGFGWKLDDIVPSRYLFQSSDNDGQLRSREETSLTQQIIPPIPWIGMRLFDSDKSTPIDHQRTFAGKIEWTYLEIKASEIENARLEIHSSENVILHPFLSTSCVAAEDGMQPIASVDKLLGNIFELNLSTIAEEDGTVCVPVCIMARNATVDDRISFELYYQPDDSEHYCCTTLLHIDAVEGIRIDSFVSSREDTRYLNVNVFNANDEVTTVESVGMVSSEYKVEPFFEPSALLERCTKFPANSVAASQGLPPFFQANGGDEINGEFAIAGKSCWSFIFKMRSFRKEEEELPDVFMQTLFSRSHAMELIYLTISRLRKQERHHRAALARAEDLPPTIRSIRLSHQQAKKETCHESQHEILLSPFSPEGALKPNNFHGFHEDRCGAHLVVRGRLSDGSVCERFAFFIRADEHSDNDKVTDATQGTELIYNDKKYFLKTAPFKLTVHIPSQCMCLHEMPVEELEDLRRVHGLEEGIFDKVLPSNKESFKDEYSAGSKDTKKHRTAYSSSDDRVRVYLFYDVSMVSKAAILPVCATLCFPDAPGLELPKDWQSSSFDCLISYDGGSPRCIPFSATHKVIGLKKGSSKSSLLWLLCIGEQQINVKRVKATLTPGRSSDQSSFYVTGNNLVNIDLSETEPVYVTTSNQGQ